MNALSSIRHREAGRFHLLPTGGRTGHIGGCQSCQSIHEPGKFLTRSDSLEFKSSRAGEAGTSKIDMIKLSLQRRTVDSSPLGDIENPNDVIRRAPEGKLEGIPVRSGKT